MALICAQCRVLCFMDGDLPLSILSLNYEQIGANFSTGFLDGHFYFGVTPEFRIRDFMLNKKATLIGSLNSVLYF